MLGVITNQAVCLKSREGDEQAQRLWECSSQWGRNHRDNISRRWLIRYYPAISSTGEIIPLFPKPLYSTQFTSVTWSCTEVQKLFLLVPSHPTLSGHINLVTSGTKKNAIGQRVYFFVTSAGERENIPDGRMEGGGLSAHRPREAGPHPRIAPQPSSHPLPETETALPAVGVCPWFSVCIFFIVKDASVNGKQNATEFISTCQAI